MFGFCSSLTSLDVSGWDTSSVTESDRILRGCPSLRSLTIGDRWTRSLTHIYSSDIYSSDGTLYGDDGTPYALWAVPLRKHATYYTKLEYVPKAKAEHVPQGDPVGKDDDEAGAPEASAAGRDNKSDADSKSDAGSVQDADSENGSPEGSGSPAADGQDETPLAA